MGLKDLLDTVFSRRDEIQMFILAILFAYAALTILDSLTNRLIGFGVLLGITYVVDKEVFREWHYWVPALLLILYITTFG